MRNCLQKSLFVLLMLASFTAQGQTIKQLEKERKNILMQLETTNKILDETHRSQKNSMNKLTVLNRNIRQRKSLISTISKEIDLLEKEIEKLAAEKEALNKRLEYLRGDYAKLIQASQISSRDNYSKFIFLLSAENFAQSYRRLRYLEEYAHYRKEQMQEIEQVQNKIALKNDSLLHYKSSKLKTVREKESETRKLSNDQQKEKKLYGNLQQKEKELLEKQKEQQKKADALNQRIEKLIAQEIKKAEEKKKKQDKKKKKGEKTPDTKTGQDAKTSVLTQEQELLAGNFEKNRGRLPWPTAKGFISGHYGIQPHPVLKYVTTNNKGVYIQTQPDSDARAVFEGVVTQRFSIPGSNNAVIIQHGNYRTVYANLTTIYVKEGQTLKAKEAIGKIYTDPEDDKKTELYFQIWKDKNIQNPEPWLTH